MKLLFQNGEEVELELNDSLTSQRFVKMYKHLQHVPLDFKPWDSCYYRNNTSFENHVNNLVFFGEKLSLTIDKSRCLNRDQHYLNYLHELYEKNYDGNSVWLDFHHHVHLCEPTYYDEKVWNRIMIDYREKGALVTKPINHDLLKELKTEIKQGEIYTAYGELGKSPYTYYCDNEPDDINRLVELVKPWTFLKPKMLIAVDDYNFLHGKNLKEFESWWKNYESKYCQYNNLEKCDNIDIFGVLVIGHVKNFDHLENLLTNSIYPTRVAL